MRSSLSSYLEKRELWLGLRYRILHERTVRAFVLLYCVTWITIAAAREATSCGRKVSSHSSLPVPLVNLGGLQPYLERTGLPPTFPQAHEPEPASDGLRSRPRMRHD